MATLIHAQAGENLMGKAKFVVRVDAAGKVLLAKDGEGHGILVTSANLNGYVTVAVLGLAKGRVGAAAVTALHDVTSDANGKLRDAKVGDSVIGRAGEAVDADKDAPVVLDQSSSRVGMLPNRSQEIAFAPKVTAQEAYTVLVRTRFGGTDVAGKPSAMRVIADVDADSTASVRVYDPAAAKVLAAKTGIGETSGYEVLDLGVLSNLPTGETVIEIQAKLAGADQQVAIAAFSVLF